MIDYAPGMRTIIRDEEWMIKKISTNNMGNKTLHCVGISTLVKDKEAIFLSDLENGKPTAELGKALFIANTLGLDCLLNPRG